VAVVNAVLVGSESFVEIDLWAKEKLDWLRRYLRLKHGICAPATFGRIFGQIDPGKFEDASRRWVSSQLPALGAEKMAIDGKTSRRSGVVGCHSARPGFCAFASRTGLVLSQRATKIHQVHGYP